MKIILPLAALAAGFLAAPAAYAQTAQSLTVHHTDLRLDTGRGVAVLDRRIARAAREACGTVAAYDRSGREAIAACRAETVAQVTPQRDALVARATRMAAR